MRGGGGGVDSLPSNYDSMDIVLEYVIFSLIFKTIMQNFAAIRSAVLEEKMFEVAIFGNFPDIPELKLSPPPVYGQPGVTLLRCTSCRVTVLIQQQQQHQQYFI